MKQYRILTAVLLTALTGPSLKASPMPPTEGLIAFYPLDGAATDESGNRQDGVATDVAFDLDRNGFVASAARFNGQSSGIRVPVGTDLNLLPMTVSAWVNLSENPATDLAIVSTYPTASANGWGLFVNADRFRAWYYAASGSVPEDRLVGPTMTRGRWYHVAAVFDQTGGRLYIDGLESVNGSWSGTPAESTSTQGLFVGEMRSAEGISQYFRGGIDDVRIYNRALSTEEIWSLFGFEAPTARRAKAEATVVNGFVVGITVADGGSGYSTAPSVEIVGDGTGATAVAEILRGRVVSVSITNAGVGYTVPPTVIIAPPPKAPKLGLAIRTVRVSFDVWAGHKYLVESSTDLEAWTERLRFTAETDSESRDFDATETGQYFRITEVP